MTSETWNKIAPVGSEVHYVTGDGFVLCTNTAGPAFDMSSGIAVVAIEGYSAPMDLSRLRLAQPPKE